MYPENVRAKSINATVYGFKLPGASVCLVERGDHGSGLKRLLAPQRSQWTMSVSVSRIARHNTMGAGVDVRLIPSELHWLRSGVVKWPQLSPALFGSCKRAL